jgi:hypothetical protein
MTKINWYRCLSPIFLLITTLSIPLKTIATPAEVFLPHLEQMQTSIPRGLTMRLPSRIMVSNASGVDPEKLIVRWFGSQNPQRFNVSLFTCEQGPLPCLLGSFTGENASLFSPQRELAKHITHGDRITLSQNPLIYGYLLEGDRKFPTPTFSSVMWQQDNMIYTVSFPIQERQNLLFMALWMAQNDPITLR